MKKYTVITKDGIKWLRPVNPFKHGEDGWHGFYDVNPDIAYLGDHIEGTTLDESEVREVRQFMIGGTIDMDDTIIEHGDWITMHDFDKARLEADLPDFLKRNAYTDADDREVDYEKEMPHKKWPSTKYVARKVDAEPHDRHIRPFRIHNVRPLVNQLVGEEISFSRFIELLNEIANTH